MKNILRLFVALIFTQLILAQVSNFEGIQYSGERPPDPVIAVSNNYIVQAVNKKLAVFNKSGTKLFEQSFSDFFSGQTPPSAIFDPKVAYDQYSNRFILLAAGKNTGGGNSNYMIAVTQNFDPTGSWYKYKLDAEDQNLTQYDIDFPGLGYDEEAIYLTSHQLDGQGSYYPKITILNKSEVYSGTISYRKDFKDFSSGGSYPAKLKPMRKIGTSSGYYIVNTESAGQIRIWKIENPLSSTNATLSVASTITLGSYSSISNATQKGTTNTVDIGDYSISDIVCIDGYLYGAYTAKNTTLNGSMIVYFKINTANNFDLMINGKIESANNYYYYPVLHPDNAGNIVFVFNKSSSNDYIGVAWTILYSGNSNIEPIQWLKQGTTWYYNLLNNRNRWGDYCGIALDPANGYRVWICGEWALTNTQWSTWIGEISTGQTIDFYFTNTINDENTGILNTNAGGTFTVNSSPVNSGQALPLETGNNFTELTNNERFGNWNSLGFTYKHNHWNESASEKFISTNFEASSSNTDQRAYFRSLNYAKIEARLEGQLITNKGVGAFQDPWYVLNNGTQPGNYWKDFTSFYEPNGKDGATENGVFLNQGGTGFTPPYYSVKVDVVQDLLLTQTGKTHRFYFQNWTANPLGSTNFQSYNILETPVVFLQSGATVQANLKGTQLSNISAGFSNSSQRKLVTTLYPDYNYHLVYASSGSVWYEKAGINAETITPTNWLLMNGAKPLNGNMNYSEAKSPSIDFCYATHNYTEENYYIYIVYQKKKSDGKYEIRLVKFDDNAEKYFDISVFSSSYTNYSTFDAMPVVAVSRQSDDQAPIKIVILWKRPVEGSASAGLYYVAGFDQGSSITWTNNYPTPLKISATDANSTNPSIAAFKKPYGNIYYHLAYQQGTSQIKYVPIEFGVRGTGSGTPSVVSIGSGSPTNVSPSITVGNSYPGYPPYNNTYDSPKIVWCNIGDEGYGIYRYRSTMQSAWSPYYIYGEMMTFKVQQLVVQNIVQMDLMMSFTSAGAG